MAEQHSPRRPGHLPLPTRSIYEHNGRPPALPSPELVQKSPGLEHFAQLYPLAPHLTPEHTPSATPATSRRSSISRKARAAASASSVAAGQQAPNANASTSSVAGDCWSSNMQDDIMANRLLGKLTINVIEARGLRADDSCQAYCLVQYDRCECVVPSGATPLRGADTVFASSVSREWGAVRPPPKEAKRGGKTPGARRGRAGLTSKRVGGGGPSASKPVNNSSSTTSSSVSNGAPLVKRQGFPGLAAEEPEASSSSSRVSSASASSNEGDDSDGDRAKGTPDSPVWNHKALL